MFNFLKKEKNIISEKVIRRRIVELNSRDTGILVSGLEISKTVKYRLSIAGTNNFVVKEIKKFSITDDIIFSIERDILRERIKKAANIVFATIPKIGEKVIDGETLYWKIEKIEIQFKDSSFKIFAKFSRFDEEIELRRIENIFKFGFSENVTENDIKIFEENAKLSYDNINRKFTRQIELRNRKLKKLSEVKEEKPKEKIIQKETLNDFSLKKETKPKKKLFLFFSKKKKEKEKKKEIPEKKEKDSLDEELEKSFDEIMELYPKELDKLNTLKDEE